jgi:ABC-type sugar transport system permease subunit
MNRAAAETSSLPARRVLRRVSLTIPGLFLAPYLVLTAFFFAWPLLDALTLAFQQTNGPASRVFVGLDNFRFLAGSADFRTALRNTLLLALGNAVLLVPLSLGLALLVNSASGRLRSFFRLALFAPHFVGQVFVGILFAVILVPRYGLLNRALQALAGWGLETPWLQTPELVLPAILLANLWVNAGFNMIYFLAALQSVDGSLVDAARIDGAGRWAVFRHVTLPAIKPVAVFVLVITTIGSFQMFELPFTLLKGYGPANAGLTGVGFLYTTAFESGDLGLASAIGWLLALLIFLVSIAQLRAVKNWATEE